MDGDNLGLSHTIDEQSTIMVVDDDPVNTHLLGEILLKEGYRVQTETNATSALNSTLADPPDLILLDIKMPDMDGITFCQRLKKSVCPHLPVIFISAIAESEEKIKAFNAGGSDYLTKPISSPELLARVRNHLNLYMLRIQLEKIVEQRTADLNREIDQHKLDQQKLERSRYQESLILNSAGEGIYGLDARGNTTFVNKAAAEMLGYTADELIGKAMHKLIHHSHPDGSAYPRKECPIYAAITDGEIHAVTDEVLWRKDGSSFPAEYTSTPIREKEQIVGAVITFSDITERKLTEKHLNEIRRRHEEAQQIAHLGHWTLDLISNELVWSDEIYRIFGLEPGAGNTYEDFLETVYPDDRDLVDHAYANSVKNRLTYNIEHRLLMKDGSIKWINERCQTHYAEDGTPVRSTGTSLDITERKIMEEKLRESKARLSGILESAAEAVISIDESQRITMFNKSAEKIFGYGHDEVLGQPLEALLPEEYRTAHKKHVVDFASTGKQGRYMAKRNEIAGRRRNGETFPIEASISKLEINGKKTFTAVLRDISRRKQNEERLRSSFIESIETLIRAAEYRDDETGAHVKRISYYTKALAEELGMDSDFCHDIFHASAMHDIGKIGIPDHILLKSSGFTPDEWELMKTHTLIGSRILAGHSSPYLQMGEQIALAHHERWDGGGYPYGLKGDAIPLAARIMQLADVYDALRSERPYKKEFTHAKSLEIITKGDGRTEPSHFDPEVLKAFKSCADTMNEIFEGHKEGKKF